MRIAAFSRKFPPLYKRRWFVCRCDKGYLLRYQGQTFVGVHFESLNHVLDVINDLNKIFVGT